MISYAGEDLRKVLFEKFEKSKLISLSWDSLTRNLESDKLSRKLKFLVLSKWINIRVNAFVKAWVNIAKLKYAKDQDNKLDAKGQPALRKTLS